MQRATERRGKEARPAHCNTHAPQIHDFRTMCLEFDAAPQITKTAKSDARCGKATLDPM